MLFQCCLDYIHDNCEGGRTERYKFHCHALLAANTYESLTSTCNELEGQLTWFDTWQEYEALTGRLWYYDQSQFNGHLYTGQCFWIWPLSCQRTCISFSADLYGKRSFMNVTKYFTHDIRHATLRWSSGTNTCKRRRNVQIAATGCQLLHLSRCLRLRGESSAFPMDATVRVLAGAFQLLWHNEHIGAVRWEHGTTSLRMLRHRE